MRIFSFLFLFICCSNLVAKNYYVSSQYGKVTFKGISAKYPKPTIQDAADLTQPGDTVFVMNGIYTNDCPTCNAVTILHSGTGNKFIVYTNYPGHKPKIKFNGWAGFSISNGVSYIVINGFEVEGNNTKVTLSQAIKQPKGCLNRKGNYKPEYNGNGIAIFSTNKKYSHHIIVSKNTVYNCGGGGISALRSDYIIFEDNIVYNNSWYALFGTSGISLYQFKNFNFAKGYHNIIRRNKCYNNKNLVPWIQICSVSDGNGIVIDDFLNQQNHSTLGKYTGQTLVENNVCWFNGGTGIHVYLSDNVNIINNTAYCNSQSSELNAGQILASRSDNIKIMNNILVSDSLNVINSNYQNKRLAYIHNLHFNITYPKRIKIKITNSTCLDNEDPMFITPSNNLSANFKLLPNSPAIDKGATYYGSKTDFETKKRPKRWVTDIGAYEY